MTMVLELTEEQKERLQRYADRLGKNPEALFLEWVDTLPLPSGSQIASVTIPPPFPGLVSYMAADFNEPLTDEFWGESDNDIHST